MGKVVRFSLSLTAHALLGSLLFLVSQSDAAAALRHAQYAKLDYDVVYVRCPRAKGPVRHPNLNEDLKDWNGVNDMWLSAANNIYQEPGCDLVLHHSAASYGGGLPLGDPKREEVLVNCNEDDKSNPVCSVADPNVSFDGRSVVYAKFMDTRNFVGNIDNGFTGVHNHGGWGASYDHEQSFMRIYPNGDGPGGSYATPILARHLQPFTAPALIFRFDLATHKETRISPKATFWAGRAYPQVGSDWHSGIPVMDTGPFFLPDGRIGFTSNRASGFYRFQLMAMDPDGKNMELIGFRALQQQLHPAILSDGRIMYTSFDQMLGKVQNNNYSLFTINPDDSNPFILAGKQDPTQFTYHFATQLSDGDIVTAIYYNHNNGGMGTLLRFPLDPPGPDFYHKNYIPGVWQMGISMVPFARVGQFTLTPEADAGDGPTRPYANPDDYWIHPYDGHTVTMQGRFTHPAAAPNNGLLVTYAIGGASVNASYYPPKSGVMQRMGKDAGVWYIPLEAHSTRQIGHIADDARIVVDEPQYHEIMPRAVVPYSRIYGKAHPTIKPVTDNQGDQDPRLRAGEPFGLTGAATLYDRETTSLNGTPWNMHDGGGVMSGRTYSNLATNGADLAIYKNSEIYGIRVLLPIPNVPDGTNPGVERMANQSHFMRILGEFPVRKPDGTPLDGQGNPDTSFMLKVPADTPFMFQTLDKRGMALDIETTSKNVAPGEQQLCGGCHVHTRESLDPYSSLAKLDTSAPYGDFSGKSAPLFASLDANGKPVVKTAQQIYGGTVPGVGSRRSFAVDWKDGISAILQQRCASCHGEGKPAQQLTGLRLDGTEQTYNLLVTNQYTREDGVRINAGTKPGNGLTDLDQPGTDRITPRYSCCTVSRWVAMDSARSSMLVWALYGQRLDGRDPNTGLPRAGSGVLVDDIGREHPEIWPKVSAHAQYVSGMPESEKRLIARWIDIGAPHANVSQDLIRPVMTLTPVNNGNGSVSTVLVGLWDDSAIDYSRFRVTANGQDITPSVSGTPEVVKVVLPTPVTADNADSQTYTFEVWDRPDRSLDAVQPNVPAANRTHMDVTGRALLRMVDTSAATASTNHAPTAAKAYISVPSGTPSAGVTPTVSDPDAGDSHTFTVVSQPSHGKAVVTGNQLVYTSNPGYTGGDSFVFRATDTGGLSVNGTAKVDVTAAVSSGGSSTGSTGSSGSGFLYALGLPGLTGGAGALGFGPLAFLSLSVLVARRRRRKSM